MRYLIILFFASLLVSTGCKTKKLTLVNPQENIESAIVDCINLLEKKQHEELLSKYIYPDVKEEILKNQTMEELVDGFKGKKADRLLNAFKIARNKEIKYIKEGSVGIIELGEQVSGPDEIEFMKKGSLWYIAD